jgi:hypothetical protein
LEEAAGDFMADLNARDAGTDLHHLAGTIRQRNDVVTHRHSVGAAYDAEIAKIERARRDLDQYLPVRRLRIRSLDFDQRIDAGAALQQLISTHISISKAGPGAESSAALTWGGKVPADRAGTNRVRSRGRSVRNSGAVRARTSHGLA